MLYVSKGGKGKEANVEEKEGGRRRENQGEKEVGEKVDKKNRSVSLKSEGEENWQNEDVESSPGLEGRTRSGGE